MEHHGEQTLETSSGHGVSLNHCSSSCLPTIKHEPDGCIYNTFLLVKVDNTLIVSHSPQGHISTIQLCHELNPKNIGQLQLQLRVDVEKVSKSRDLTGNEY